MHAKLIDMDLVLKAKQNSRETAIPRMRHVGLGQFLPTFYFLFAKIIHAITV